MIRYKRERELHLSVEADVLKALMDAFKHHDIHNPDTFIRRLPDRYRHAIENFSSAELDEAIAEAAAKSKALGEIQPVHLHAVKEDPPKVPGHPIGESELAAELTRAFSK